MLDQQQQSAGSVLEAGTIRVVVAAPTPALRVGLQSLLTGSGIEVVSVVATIAEVGLDTADVLVLADDDQIGDLEQLAAETRPATLVLSSDAKTFAMLHEIGLRGWAVVPPEAPAAELQAAIAAVAQGLVVVSPTLAATLLQRQATPLPADPLDEPLTAREAEVLQLLGQGLSNKQIARALQISEHTVKFHVSAVYSKLGAASRADAVSRGARRGLLTL